jgi:DNA end-binding protein Ku
MRSIWRGAINFGMVTIPVKLYSATEQKDVRFHMVHKKDGARIVEKRFCSEEDKEVPWDEIGKGYEVSKGEYVVMDREEVEAAGDAQEQSRTIDIGDFVEIEEIDPIYFEKSYFLEPTDVGIKPFNLLRRALDETGRVAVAKVAIRSKERLATLRVYDSTMVLETMYWPDEIRSTDELDLPSGKTTTPQPREVDMARTLIESLASHFDPDQYKDEFRGALLSLIEQKMKGEQRSSKRRKPEPKVVDLMEALQASLASAKAGTGASKSASSSRSSGSPRSARASRSGSGSSSSRKTRSHARSATSHEKSAA